MSKPMTIEDLIEASDIETVARVNKFRAAIEAYAAEQVAVATARDSAIIKMVDEARTAGRYSDAEEWNAIDAAIRARAQEE